MQVVYRHNLRNRFRQWTFAWLVNYFNKNVNRTRGVAWLRRRFMTGNNKFVLQHEKWHEVVKNTEHWKSNQTCTTVRIHFRSNLSDTKCPTCGSLLLLTVLGDTSTGKMVPCVVKSLRNKVLSLTDSRDDSVRGRDSTITFTPLNQAFQIIMRAKQWDT